jgi:hypothetical protein
LFQIETGPEETAEKRSQRVTALKTYGESPTDPRSLFLMGLAISNMLDYWLCRDKFQTTDVLIESIEVAQRYLEKSIELGSNFEGFEKARELLKDIPRMREIAETIDSILKGKIND